MDTDELTQPTDSVAVSRVSIIDHPSPQVRNPSDLVNLIGNVLGIVLVCLLVVYAHNTTAGMAADVQGFAVLLQRILFIPVTVLDLIVVLFPPIAIGLDLLIRRQSRVALQGLVGAASGIAIGMIVVFLIDQWGPEFLVNGLSIHRGALIILTIPTQIFTITALLTAVATPTNRRSITWSWNLMWISVVVAVVTGATSLAGMAMALLIGRSVGFATRYLLGVSSMRAYGQDLIDGIRRAGFTPVSLERVSEVQIEQIGDTEPEGDTEPRSDTESDSDIEPKSDTDPESDTELPSTRLPLSKTGHHGTHTPQFFSDHRLYVMKTAAGKTHNVIVLDGDRQVKSVLSRLWRYLRSRSVEGRISTVSLRHSAERTVVISYALRSAGVSTPAVLSMAEAESSMIIVREATPKSVSFSDLSEDGISDELLDSMWAEILKAHRCGIVHRSLTSDCFRVVTSHLTQASTQSDLSVLGWESGDLAASALAQRVDLTQLLSLMAAKVGSTRAVASAGRALDKEELAGLGPLLQVPAIPKPTRDQMGDAKAVLAQLRTELAEDLPIDTFEPAQITRVGARTIIMAILVTAIVIAIVTSLNLGQVVQALRDSDWRWAVASLAIGLFGFVGAAIALIAYAPVKLSFWRVCMCQVSAAFIAMAAPVGLGPAAVNLRMLLKKNVATPVATATVALTQVTNVIVMLLGLVVLTVVTGSNQLGPIQITPGMLVAILVVVLIVAVVLIVPKSRGWVISRVLPLLRQTWPRLVELLSSPYRLFFGILGNVIVAASYITALQWAALAFGQHISLLAAAMVYLIGTSAGSIIPTPGGIGAVEVTESAVLVSIGINAGVAASIVLLFRLMTYWIRIPLGWISYRWLTKVGEL